MSDKKRSPWYWIPTLYYAEGIPYIIVMTVSVIFYKRMGISNTEIAFYTSWLYLPWVIKPFWSPLVDIVKTKRFWIVTMQLLLGAGLGGVALTIPLPAFFQLTLAFFWLLAFSSATHDIAVDGFYMLGLTQHEQAWYVGVRSTFYRFAMITGQGLLIILAGFIESHSGLDNIEVEISADTRYEKVVYAHPDSLELTFDDTGVRIMTIPEKLEIPIVPVPGDEIDSVRNFIVEWNTMHGHALDQTGPEKITDPAKVSWWQHHISDPLKNFLSRNFAEKKKSETALQSGNYGIFYVYLSKEPESEEDIVINFGHESGDKSILLSEVQGAGSRIVFNRDNWNIPAMALIQIDPKLDTRSEAAFLAQSGNIPLAWSLTFFFLSGLFILFFIYHKFILPYPKSDRPGARERTENFMKEFIRTFVLFFKKDRIMAILGFLLLFRFAEAQIVKLASPFLLDAKELNGLGLTTGEVGFVYGTVGLIMLTIGGLLGGFLAAKHGLKFWIWPMAIAINLPDVVYIYLSYALPDSMFIINLCVGIEQFGYGFGFTAYMLYMIYASQGEHETAHFAITTGFMALGMMIPGMFSGWLQEIIGYKNFFIWVVIATIPSFLVLLAIPLDKNFGKKTEESATG